MLSNKRFGPFILDGLIGRGGMGAVYRAHREDDGRVVAVKALLVPLDQERERFSAEIATMKLLRHDNIVRLYGFGQEEGTLYYAMEFVDGPSLSTLLKRGTRFTWEEVVYIGASICRALKHAHDRGVVHRDIKPANILLVGEGVVKVSDYGIAQYFGSSRLTGANQVVGTIEYMAPEQARAGALTPHTDMYSLGALMYVLLTGKPPYPARSLAELLQQYRQGPPDSIRLSRPEIPKVVDEVVLDLLKIQTNERPGDARVIGRRLEAILKTSRECPDGNPFKGCNFTLRRPAIAKESTENSRVDLENPSATSLAEDAAQGAEQCPDVPDCPVSDEEPEPVSNPNAIYDTATEPATGVDAEAERSVESETDSESEFSLSGETSEVVGNSTKTTAASNASELWESPSSKPRGSSRPARPSRGSDAPTRTSASDSVPRPLAEKNAAETAVAEAPSEPPRAEKPTPSTDELRVVPVSKFKRSLFTPVDETELDRLPKEPSGDSKYALIRIAVMISIFLGIVALAYDLSRKPSADKMFGRFDRKLMVCRPAEFEDVLKRVEKDMNRFKSEYPSDPRVARVRYFLSAMEVDELEQKLERQIQNPSRATSKDPIERAYLDVCRSTMDNPAEAIKKFRAFILLFDAKDTNEETLRELCNSDGESADWFYRKSRDSQKRRFDKSPEDNPWRRWNGQQLLAGAAELTSSQKIILIAKRRLATALSEKKTTDLADLAQLNDRFGVARDFIATDLERAEGAYAAAVELYGEQEWARPALASFRADLDAAKNAPPAPQETEANENADPDESPESVESSGDSQ